MTYETIDWQQNGNVVVATLNRPESLNAINQKMDHELIDAFNRVRNDDSIRVMILTGAGRAFCAGDDIKERDSGENENELNRDLTGPGSVLTNNYLNLWSNLDTGKPIIAAVNGYALGGGLELTYETNDMTLSQAQRMSAFSRWIIQQTDDAQEGPRAFVEKRKPEYNGR